MKDLKNRIGKNILCSFFLVFLIVVIVVVVLGVMNSCHLMKKSYYSAKDFSIETIYSVFDYNDNGLDDYSDFVLGARKCKLVEEQESDVLFCAFEKAGYSLESLIDNQNMMDYFERSSLSLTLDKDLIEEFQPGDIVYTDTKVGVVSDRRNSKGVPYLIYIKNGKVFEKDCLEIELLQKHYRFVNNT